MQKPPIKSSRLPKSKPSPPAKTAPSKRKFKAGTELLRIVK